MTRESYFLCVHSYPTTSDIEVNFQLDNYALLDLQLNENSIDFIARSK